MKKNLESSGLSFTFTFAPYESGRWPELPWSCIVSNAGLALGSLEIDEVDDENLSMNHDIQLFLKDSLSCAGYVFEGTFTALSEWVVAALRQMIREVRLIEDFNKNIHEWMYVEQIIEPGTEPRIIRWELPNTPNAREAVAHRYGSNLIGFLNEDIVELLTTLNPSFSPPRSRGLSGFTWR
ncbi:hypothetical protein AAA573_24760 [Pseudomonas aeruginosa]